VTIIRNSGRELHLLIDFDCRGRVDHLEMAGEGQDGLGASVALVLEDPNYEHRRRYYEHLVNSEKRIRKEEGL